MITVSIKKWGRLCFFFLVIGVFRKLPLAHHKKTLKFRYHFVFGNKYAINFRVSDFLIRIIVYTIMKVN